MQIKTANTTRNANVLSRQDTDFMATTYLKELSWNTFILRRRQAKARRKLFREALDQLVLPTYQ